MKKLAAIFIELVIICTYTVIYVALTEKLTLANVMIGFALSSIALFITHKILMVVQFYGR